MKNSLLYVIIIALLFFAVTPASAGFWVNRNVSAVQTSAVTSSSVETQTTSTTKVARKYNLPSKLFPKYRYYDRTYGQKQWVGIVAFSCGILGLFIPGLNFAAILFGLLGLGKKSRMKGLATAGFVLGILELMLFLIAGTVFISLITL